MTQYRNLLLGLMVATATFFAGSSTAHAQRKMLVLIDASGSMDIARPGDAVNPTRFAAAKTRAKEQIISQAAFGLAGVAVYTFSDATATPQTAGFVDANTAITAINGLDLFTVGGGVTPLAGSVCDAVDVLVADGGATKILGLSSDGEENSTPLGHVCQGPFSTIPDPPYSVGSWQNLVLNYVVDHNIAPYIDLFDPGPITGFAARRAFAADPEGNLTAGKRAVASFAAAAAAEDGPPTLEEFFTELARAAGGRLTVITDEQPALPKFGDLTGNSCVDRADALQIARAFGASGDPQDLPEDLNGDGRVGFADYAATLSSFTAGGCGVADPFTARAPLICSGITPVVIDRKSIENGGITIDARGTCNVIIRNSLIVSGSSAIKVLGAATITVDNSTLVGEGAVLSTSGATVLSAANTVFHGKRTVSGVLAFLDRGGNVWE